MADGTDDPPSLGFPARRKCESNTGPSPVCDRDASFEVEAEGYHKFVCGRCKTRDMGTRKRARAKSYLRSVMFQLHTDGISALKEAAAEMDTSVTAIITDALEQWFEGREVEAPDGLEPLTPQDS